MTIEALNELTEKAARQQFQACCTAESWINDMVEGRPYADEQDLFDKADQAWEQVDYNGWLQACEGHPKIGDVHSLAKKFHGTKEWAGNEQSGMKDADREVIERLAEGNRKYEEKFGFIFIVFATGKSASEMLELLETRLPNTMEKELPVARGEQHKITRLRLQKMLGKL